MTPKAENEPPVIFKGPQSLSGLELHMRRDTKTKLMTTGGLRPHGTVKPRDRLKKGHGKKEIRGQ
jgi:hypothetical protein